MLKDINVNAMTIINRIHCKVEVEDDDQIRYIDASSFSVESLIENLGTIERGIEKENSERKLREDTIKI